MILQVCVIVVLLLYTHPYMPSAGLLVKVFLAELQSLFGLWNSV